MCTGRTPFEYYRYSSRYASYTLLLVDCFKGSKKDLTSASFTTCPCCAKGRRYFTRLSLERMLRRKSMKKTESGIPHGIKSMNSIYCSITGETMQCTHAQLFE